MVIQWAITCTYCEHLYVNTYISAKHIRVVVNNPNIVCDLQQLNNTTVNTFAQASWISHDGKKAFVTPLGS